MTIKDHRKKPAPKRRVAETYDYRSADGQVNLPAHVVEIIKTAMAIEEEDAKAAGSIGYMARAMITATMPYKDPKERVFTRRNGNFQLEILAGYEGGVPYGIYPRLLMSWLTTEAVLTKSPTIQLGDSLSHFLREVLEIRTITGGANGTGTRVTEQMKRLFGAFVSARYEAKDALDRSWSLKNVMIADHVKLKEASGDYLWKPQAPEDMGKWKSEVRLSENFFREIVDRPVPIDLRAYKALRKVPLAMDIYCWLTYRMKYMRAPSAPIRWEALMAQFGSNYTSERAHLDFKRGFLNALSLVNQVYPKANVGVTDTGLILRPSPPHVASSTKSQLQLI